MAGQEDWTTDQVKEVFTAWEDAPALLPARSQRADVAGGRRQSPEDAGRPGCSCSARSCPSSSPTTSTTSTSSPIPAINEEYGQDVDRRPDRRLHDGRRARRTRRPPRTCSRYLGTPEASDVFLTGQPGGVAANSDADTVGYNAVAAEVGRARSAATANIAQFLDRDTNPDFAPTWWAPPSPTSSPTRARSTRSSARVEEQKQSSSSSRAERKDDRSPPHRPAATSGYRDERKRRC